MSLFELLCRSRSIAVHASLWCISIILIVLLAANILPPTQPSVVSSFPPPESSQQRNNNIYYDTADQTGGGSSSEERNIKKTSSIISGGSKTHKSIFSSPSPWPTTFSSENPSVVAASSECVFEEIVPGLIGRSTCGTAAASAAATAAANAAAGAADATAAGDYRPQADLESLERRNDGHYELHVRLPLNWFWKLLLETATSANALVSLCLSWPYAVGATLVALLVSLSVANEYKQ